MLCLCCTLCAVQVTCLVFVNRIWHSVAFRLALICGSLVVLSVLLISGALYFGTIVVMERNVDTKIAEITTNFSNDAKQNGLLSVARRIEKSLSDGVDSDVEILLLVNPQGIKLAGNIPGWVDVFVPVDKNFNRQLLRPAGVSDVRMRLHRFDDGALMVVGRDMRDLGEVRILIVEAVAVGGILALILAIVGTYVFRRQLEKRIWTIRQTTLDIEAGNLERRIKVANKPDEFDRLSEDINRMLDRMQHLMDGVRHVSNTIAHNMRTPLGLIRNRLEEVLRTHPDRESLEAASVFTIEGIDNLIVVLEKLLQISEAESGTRRQPFSAVSIREVIQDLIDLYAPAAEDHDIRFKTSIEGTPQILGDRDLLTGILINLFDNSIKYAADGATIHIQAFQDQSFVTLIVEDNGLGIPKVESKKVLQRFYRLNKDQRGSGLGLSIVAAFTQLHDGDLFLEDAKPGMRVRMRFPRAAE